jgi:hypothetical protein
MLQGYGDSKSTHSHYALSAYRIYKLESRTLGEERWYSMSRSKGIVLIVGWKTVLQGRPWRATACPSTRLSSHFHSVRIDLRLRVRLKAHEVVNCR